MDIKVQILTSCMTCNGTAYLPAGEATSYSGERYLRYEPCAACQGSGRQTRWISLEELSLMLAEVINTEPTRHEIGRQLIPEVIQPILSQP